MQERTEVGQFSCHRPVPAGERGPARAHPILTSLFCHDNVGGGFAVGVLLLEVLAKPVELTHPIDAAPEEVHVGDEPPRVIEAHLQFRRQEAEQEDVRPANGFPSRIGPGGGECNGAVRRLPADQARRAGESIQCRLEFVACGQRTPGTRKMNGLVHHRDGLRKREHPRHGDRRIGNGSDEEASMHHRCGCDAWMTHDTVVGTPAGRRGRLDVDIRRPVEGPGKAPEGRRGIGREDRRFGAHRRERSDSAQVAFGLVQGCPLGGEHVHSLPQPGQVLLLIPRAQFLFEAQRGRLRSQQEPVRASQGMEHGIGCGW
ncbi:hypothetical protein EDD25_1343 [Cryobacterium psychrophilum]|nr:hypothetical protein EDD25_1343 [Cryobacterium psychrophilum]